MNDNLFSELHHHEVRRLGSRPLDLHDNPILGSGLSAFNRFLCRDLEGVGSDLHPTSLHGEQVDKETLKRYCEHLYQRLDLRTRDVSQYLFDLCDFIAEDWGPKRGLSLARIQDLLDLLKRKCEEIRRCRLLYKHLRTCSEHQRMSLGPLDPFEPQSQSDHQLRLFSPENPVTDDSVVDLWIIQVKHVKAQRLLLRGEQSGTSLSIALPKVVINNSKKGDHLPMHIGEAWDGQRFVLGADLPRLIDR